MASSTISTKKTTFSSVTLCYKNATPQAERLELRMAELDHVYRTEVKRLSSVLEIAKQNLFISGNRGSN